MEFHGLGLSTSCLINIPGPWRQMPRPWMLVTWP